MGLFFKNHIGFMNEIRCDEPDYLVWKWHPKGSQPGANPRENAIRWGSSLRVKDGEAAILVYSQYGKNVQEYIEGPCDMLLETANLPVLADIIGIAYNSGTPFQAEVYFVNLAKIIQAKFGVPFFDVFDPRFPDFGVPVAVRGTVSFQITDYREFIGLHRLSTFNLSDFQLQIRDAISRYVKDIVSNAPAVHNIPVVQIETKTAQITDTIEYDVAERLKENFGVTTSGVDISAIEIDKSSDGYCKLMAITKDITETKIQAETSDYIERLRIQREEAQYLQRKQTESANFAAYQMEKHTEVGLAGAEALGKMGANGTSTVELGSTAGFNPAAMMAGIALGNAVSQNVAGVMNRALSGSGVQPAETTPPIKTAVYYVVANEQAMGPFDIEALKQMVSVGKLTENSLVWKKGMPDWEKANSQNDLKNLFVDIMPPIPSTIK